MKLRNLSDKVLTETLENLVKKEHCLTAEIVEHIAEVERRRLYLKLGAASLYEYLTKNLKYASGPAQRRIDAARLYLVAPELLENIEKGEINLSQVAKIATACRATETTPEIKRELVEKVKGLSVNETEVLVAQVLDIPPVQFDKVKHQQDGSKRIEFTVTEEAWEKFQRLKEVLSHIHPNGNWMDLFMYASEEVLKKKDLTRARAKDSPTNANAQYQVEVVLSEAEARRKAFQRDKCCQWKDHNGKICGSYFQLEVDHIVSKWKGGKYELENLQLLCSVHNKLKYELFG